MRLAFGHGSLLMVQLTVFSWHLSVTAMVSSDVVAQRLERSVRTASYLTQHWMHERSRIGEFQSPTL
eukprot:4148663-Pleurochrysis_carterae.AAC.2